VSMSPMPPSPARGDQEQVGPVRALDRVDFASPRRGRGPRRRQTEAGKSTLVRRSPEINGPDTGHDRLRRQRVRSTNPRTPWRSGSRTSTRIGALRQLGRRRQPLPRTELHAPGIGKNSRQLDEVRMEHETAECCDPGGHIPASAVRSGTLSGGQRQQVAVARSCLGKPEGRISKSRPLAGRAADQTVLELILKLTRARPRRRRDQPQPADVFQIADESSFSALGRPSGDSAHEVTEEVKSRRGSPARGRQQSTNRPARQSGGQGRGTAMSATQGTGGPGSEGPPGKKTKLTWDADTAGSCKATWRRSASSSAWRYLDHLPSSTGRGSSRTRT